MITHRIETACYEGRSAQQCYEHVCRTDIEMDPTYAQGWSQTAGVKRSPLYPTAVRIDEIDNTALDERSEQIQGSGMCEAFPIIEVVPAVTGRVHVVKMDIQTDRQDWQDRGWSAINDAFRAAWLRADHKGTVITDVEGEDLDVSQEKYLAGMVQDHVVTSKSSVTTVDGSEHPVRTRWFIYPIGAPGPRYLPRWEEGHATRAEAKKDAASRSTGEYDIVGMSMREDGAPVMRVTVTPPSSARIRMQVTATVREVIHPEQITGRTGWYLYGHAPE